MKTSLRHGLPRHPKTRVQLAQSVQPKWRAASGCRDVTTLPAGFTVNNQEATPWYCSHNCDCVCGQAKSENEKCLETRCPATVLTAQEGLLFSIWNISTYCSRPDDITSPSPGLPFTSKDETPLSAVLLEHKQAGVCVCAEKKILWGKKEQSWFRVY